MKIKCIYKQYETIIELKFPPIPGDQIELNNRKFLISKREFIISEGMYYLWLVDPD